ncbi:hypothetical protein LQV63_29200 [Paenibacillus profundus]|uniref:Lipoprotein n=1 Tax=Paenibacillus profundus TaxID=1173085 RepID=A0ABS8YUN5_9BACL|nr:hypothetical protein [Paenibacillus profundus]MCE5173334.1 hypothetical protein [Paenibacillus profundus]
MKSSDQIVNVRRWVVLLMLVFAIIGLVGCTSKQSTINVSAARIEEHMKQSVKLDKLKKGDANKLKKLYGIWHRTS